MNEFYLLSGICFLAMLSPGPDFILVAKNSLVYPRAQALATAAGIISSCLVHASLSALGLTIILSKSVLLYSLVKYLGAGYLIYLGLKGLFFSDGTVQLNNKDYAREVMTLQAAFSQGFLCNFLNPKLAIFLLSLFTQFISVDAEFHQRVYVAAVFFLEAAIFWPIMVLLIQNKYVRAVFIEAQELIDRIFGAILAAIGVKIIVSDI